MTLTSVRSNQPYNQRKEALNVLCENIYIKVSQNVTLPRLKDLQINQHITHQLS